MLPLVTKSRRPTRRLLALALWLACSVGPAACRCDRGAPPADAVADAAATAIPGQPTMPEGLLAKGAREASAGSELGRRLAGFELGTNKPAGAHVAVVRLAGEGGSGDGGASSAYFGFDALPFLHGALGRARPGFALLTPQRFEVGDLDALSRALVEERDRWRGATRESAAEAGAPLARSVATEADFARLRDAVVRLVSELISIVDAARHDGDAVELSAGA